MEKIFVKPTEGRIVIHPVSGRQISLNGETVYKCPQIKRYLKFGDLVIAKETKQVKKDETIK